MFPFLPVALGSTDIARVYWEAMAIGAAITGTIITMGENVCAMDSETEIKHGRVIHSPEMERRVKAFKRWYTGEGEIIVQHNVEDKRLGVPEYAIAGGFCLEDQIFKALALGAPFVGAVCLGRSSMTAVMVAKTIENAISKGEIPQRIKKYGKDFKEIPAGAIGFYTYYERLETGLQQLMAGARKFNLSHITRDDIFALTKAAEKVSKIPFVMDVDKDEVEKILG